MNESLNRLPKEPVDRFTKPLAQFLRIESLTGAVLLVCAAAAIAVSNSPWSTSFLAFWETPLGLHLGAIEFSRSLKHWINDGLMTLFFFVVALELKRELVVGELRNPRMAALSLAGALGGMIVPASVYLLLVPGGPAVRGWGTVMATDTAFVIGCLAVLGSRIPLSLRLFLLSLAIFDDIGAILVVAIGYGGDLNWLAMALAVLGLGVVAALAHLGVRSVPAYLMIGALVWIALDASGIHATLAGVALGLMTPTDRWISSNRLQAILGRIRIYPSGDPESSTTEDRRDLQRAGIATREVLSPVERLESALHPWVAFAVMPIFALANAGVPISPADFSFDVALAVVIGFVLGKPLGVLLFSVAAVRIGLAVRPESLGWGVLAAGGLLTGIGFTMALFIAELAFGPSLLNSAKLGILGASAIAGTLGMLALFWLTSSNSHREGSTVPAHPDV